MQPTKLLSEIELTITVTTRSDHPCLKDVLSRQTHIHERESNNLKRNDLYLKFINR